MSRIKGNNEFEAEYLEAFSKRLEELRLDAGVSARDMSLSLGQNPGYINNIENMKSLPSLSMLFLICEYLHVTPSYFLSTFDTDTKAVKQRELMSMVERLTPQQFDALFTIVHELTRRRLP